MPPSSSDIVPGGMLFLYSTPSGDAEYPGNKTNMKTGTVANTIYNNGGKVSEEFATVHMKTKWLYRCRTVKMAAMDIESF